MKKKNYLRQLQDLNLRPVTRNRFLVYRLNHSTKLSSKISSQYGDWTHDLDIISVTL